LAPLVSACGQFFIFVPYGTGGGFDILARQIGRSADRLQTLWGPGIAVDNRAGASDNFGTEAVVESPADGYTLLLQDSTMVVTLPSIENSITTSKPTSCRACCPA
jgi:tripartite-type tricarboxylate transporter receptor subunit TctC